MLACCDKREKNELALLSYYHVLPINLSLTCSAVPNINVLSACRLDPIDQRVVAVLSCSSHHRVVALF